MIMQITSPSMIDTFFIHKANNYLSFSQKFHIPHLEYVLKLKGLSTTHLSFVHILPGVEEGSQFRGVN